MESGGRCCGARRGWRIRGGSKRRGTAVGRRAEARRVARESMAAAATDVENGGNERTCPSAWRKGRDVWLRTDESCDGAGSELT